MCFAHLMNAQKLPPLCTNLIKHEEDYAQDLALRLLTLERVCELRTDDFFHAVNLVLLPEDVEIEQLQQRMLSVLQVSKPVLQEVAVAAIVVHSVDHACHVLCAHLDTVAALDAHPEAYCREHDGELARRKSSLCMR